jgi:putative thioredoxin
MAYELTDFQTDVLARSQQTPVLVDFWAAWCGPCKMLGPVLEKLAAEAQGRWALVKIDTEAHPELAAQFGIRGIPDVKLFHHGEVVAEFSGALPEPHLRQWLAEHLPTPQRDAMARARELLHAGRATEAATLLRPLADADPGDQELAVLTARALVFAAPADAERRVAGVPHGSAWDDGAALVRALAAAFRSPAERPHLGDTPLGSRYLTGLAHLQRGEFEAGLAVVIEVLQEKPGFDDNRARALCLAVFRHLGMRHAITERFHRGYSMAVNV